MRLADGDGRPTHRVLMWLGHYYPRISPGLYLIILIGAIVGLWITPTPPEAFAWAKTVAITIITLMSVFRDFIHNRNLCLRDLNEAPLLNPQEAVDKHLSYLRRHHKRSWTLIITSLVGLIGCGILLGSTGTAYPWPWFVRAAITVLVVVGAVAGYRIDRTNVVHDRLQPWCPWCRRGGGEDDEAKQPTPVPGGTRSA